MNTQVKSDILELGDGQLYYEVAGTGETLVMVHAGFVDSGMWDEQWQELSRHFRVIRYDMRGYGQSSQVNENTSNRNDLSALLKHLNVEHAYLMGCSMGGEMVLDFALEHPEMVEALVLVSATPSGFEFRGEPPRGMMEMMEAAQQGDVERASELQIRIWVDGQFREPQQVDARVRQRAADMNRIFIENGTWGKTNPQPIDPPAVKRLSDVRVPTLIIVGALDHPEILRAADVMANAIRDAKKVVLPNSAHVPNMEKPQEFNRAVVQFLDSVDK